MSHVVFVTLSDNDIAQAPPEVTLQYMHLAVKRTALHVQ